MNCPRCNGIMEPAEFGGVAIVACADCAGTWIDAASVNRLFAGEKDAVDLANALEAMFELEYVDSRRKCPRCADRRLKAVEIDGTELDYCLACKGLFFDKGELRRVYPETSYKNGANPDGGESATAARSLWQRLRRVFGRSRIGG